VAVVVLGDREAERLLMVLGLPLRAADALHLALATDAQCRVLMTFDARLGAAAEAAGFEVCAPPR